MQNFLGLSDTPFGYITHVTDASGRVTLIVVYLAPKLYLNLISDSKCSPGLAVNFSTNASFVQDPRTCQRVGVGHRQGLFYYLEYLHVSEYTTSIFPSICASVPYNIDMWY